MKEGEQFVMKIPMYAEVSGSRIKDGKVEIVRGRLLGPGMILRDEEIIMVYPRTIVYIDYPKRGDNLP